MAGLVRAQKLREICQTNCERVDARGKLKGGELDPWRQPLCSGFGDNRNIRVVMVVDYGNGSVWEQACFY